MWKIKDAIPVSLLMLLVISCNMPDDGAIHEKDPFFVEQLITPAVSKHMIVDLSRKFAERHNMRVEHSFSHFKEGEYSVILISDSINIVSSNVGRGRSSLITAYSKHNKPTDLIKYGRIVDQYKCDVFDNCSRSAYGDSVLTEITVTVYSMHLIGANQRPPIKSFQCRISPAWLPVGASFAGGSFTSSKTSPLLA